MNIGTAITAAGSPLPAIFLLAIAGGCQTYMVASPEPVKAEQIIAWSREGKSPEEILSRIAESRTVYILKAADVRDLLEKGVDEKIVDYMLETRLRDLERYYRQQYYSWYPYPYWGHFHWYYYH